jgi:SAM-dependent methyltransferase
MKDDVIQWLSPHELSGIYSGDYWNDLTAEQEKAWWILDGNGADCLGYLESSGLLSQYREAEAFIERLPTPRLEVADLAAGIGWTTALLSRIENVSAVHAVEISEHRIGSLFAAAMDLFEGERAKIHRYLGSFYDTKFEDHSIDVVFMCQAFHHADEPNRLLREIVRVLRPTGSVVIVGEHNVTSIKTLKRFLRELSRGRIQAKFLELWPTDDVLGDHYYTHSMYRRMFAEVGLSARLSPAPMDTRMITARLRRP